MSGGDMRDVIAVQVSVHSDSGLMELEMVLRARQRREREKLEQINGQFLLNDLYVALYRLRRVVGESHNVTATGQHSSLLPGEQHRPVLGDLILLFLGADERVRVY